MNINLSLTLLDVKLVSVSIVYCQHFLENFGSFSVLRRERRDTTYFTHLPRIFVLLLNNQISILFPSTFLSDFIVLRVIVDDLKQFL